MDSDQVEGEIIYMLVVDPLSPLVNLSPLINKFRLNPAFSFLLDLFSYDIP